MFHWCGPFNHADTVFTVVFHLNIIVVNYGIIFEIRWSWVLVEAFKMNHEFDFLKSYRATLNALTYSFDALEKFIHFNIYRSLMTFISFNIFFVYGLNAFHAFYSLHGHQSMIDSQKNGTHAHRQPNMHSHVANKENIKITHIQHN